MVESKSPYSLLCAFPMVSRGSCFKISINPPSQKIYSSSRSRSQNYCNNNPISIEDDCSGVLCVDVFVYCENDSFVRQQWKKLYLITLDIAVYLRRTKLKMFEAKF